MSIYKGYTILFHHLTFSEHLSFLGYAKVILTKNDLALLDQGVITPWLDPLKYS